VKRRAKILLFLFLILLSFGGFFGFGKISFAEEPAVIFNELMWMGSSISSADEWIELKNLTATSINFNLTPWSIYKNDSLMLVINNGILEKNSYFLISNNSKNHSFTGGQSVLNIDPNFIDTSVSLSNSSAQYKLYDAPTNAGNLIDTVDDGTGTPLAGKNETSKKSMERNDEPGDGTKKESWHACFEPVNLDDTASDCATPKAKNSTGSSPPPPVIYSDKIRINEILPNPSGDEDTDEFIEIYNFNSEQIDLEKWQLKDKSGKIYTFPKKIIGVNEYLSIYSSDTEIALNNSDETIYLLDPNKKEASKIYYLESAKEDVSYNFDSVDWHWSKFLTPGEENIFNNEPYGTIKIDRDVFVDVFADFSVSTGDADGEKIKVTWEFGDGHKSYKEKTTHTYDTEGTYAGTVKLSDGSEDIIKNFTIEVKKYPTPKIEIVKIKANPKGKDTDKSKGEEIYLKNNSKKKINLKTWSIATGSKTLYNHPINKDFIIKPGKTKKITRKHSLFTLNNKKGVIELRYPNGEVASRVKYDKKKESVKDDEVYELSGKKWQWNAPPEEITTPENNLSEDSSVSAENSEDLNQDIDLNISEEEISLNLGKYSTENKLALAEIKFKFAEESLLQSRENSGIVLGAFSVRHETAKPIEIKSVNHWQKTLQKSNWFLNFLINRIIDLI